MRLILNDYIFNPGPSMGPIPAKGEAQPADEPEKDGRQWESYGLMALLLRRWSQRLPQALALGAGEHVQVAKV